MTQGFLLAGDTNWPLNNTNARQKQISVDSTLIGCPKLAIVG
ncbi:hypothetical protein P20429_0132 [Pseudoalteromonas sp. BSi20429]|nr:hypothetical protein P20429_0132 [Pseudoalteromonas sp. BSi20429]